MQIEKVKEFITSMISELEEKEKEYIVKAEKDYIYNFSADRKHEGAFQLKLLLAQIRGYEKAEKD